MKVRDFHSMDGYAARESGRLSMMEVYFKTCEDIFDIRKAVW